MLRSIHIQFVFNSCPIHVQFKFNSCSIHVPSIHVQFMFNSCSIHVQYVQFMFNSCSIYGQFIYSLYTPLPSPSPPIPYILYSLPPDTQSSKLPEEHCKLLNGVELQPSQGAGASFQLFLGGPKFFYIFQCHRTIEKLEKTALYM